MFVDLVLFDFDGVLAESGRFKKYLQTFHNLKLSQTAEFFEGENFLKCREGKADLKTEIAPFLIKWNIGTDVETFLEKWFKIDSKIIKASLEYFFYLKEKGICVGIASTQEVYRKEYLEKHYDFIRECEYKFFSCDLGHTKSKDDYYKVINIMMNNKKILLIDDSLDNVMIAIKNKWKGVHFNYEQFDWRNVNKYITFK